MSTPGWGPGDLPDTQRISTYTWYDNEEEWTQEVGELTRLNRSFLPIVAQVPVIETQVTIRARK